MSHDPMMPGEHPTHTVEVHKAKVVSLQTGATLNGRAKEDKAPPKLRFTLVRFADLKADNEPEYLVPGIIPAEGFGVVWGPPKEGKSFWIFDLLMHPTNLAATRARASGSSCPSRTARIRRISGEGRAREARASGSQRHLDASSAKSARERCPDLSRADDEDPELRSLHGKIRCSSMYESTSRGTRASISPG